MGWGERAAMRAGDSKRERQSAGAMRGREQVEPQRIYTNNFALWFCFCYLFLYPKNEFKLNQDIGSFLICSKILIPKLAFANH